MIDFRFQPTSENINFIKRDVSPFFSWKFTSNIKLGSLIRNLINPIFELPYFDRISGWIGQDDYIDNNYYYKITESTPDRNHYQLCPFVVSTNESNEVESAVHYVDIINSLKSQGALTGNVNRLLKAECKSWCPPIDPDMLVNFLQYIWSPLGTYIYEIHNETNLTDDIIGKKYASITLDTTHTVIDDNPNSETYGEEVEVNDTLELKSGMRFRVYNDKDSSHNDIVYIVNGVGRSITLQDDREFGNIYEYNTFDDLPEVGSEEYSKIYAVLDTNTLYKWNDYKKQYETYTVNAIEPDYVTIQRQSEDYNDWSRHNRWFNFALMNNSRLYYLNNSIKATHQIIQFVKNIKLYNHGTFVVDTVDCYFEGNINVLYGKTEGFEIPSLDPIRPNPTLRDGMKILVKNSLSEKSVEEIYIVSGASQGVSNLSKVDIEFKDNDEVYVREGYRQGLLYWKNNQFNTCLSRSDSEYPLYDLYDSNYIALDSKYTYPDSTFAGSKLFGYKLEDGVEEHTEFVCYMNYDLDGKIGYFYDFVENSYKTFLNATSRDIESNYVQFFYVKDNSLNYILDLVPDSIVSVSVNTKNVTNYVVNGPIVSFTKPLNVNDIIKVQFKYSGDYPDNLENAYLEPTKLLTVLPENEKIYDIPYNTLLSQMVDIISNQEGFTGNAWSQNNFYSSPQDISLGTKIFVSYSRLDRLSLINQMEGVDVKSAIVKIGEKYTEFKRRFIQRVMFLSQRDGFTEEMANDDSQLSQLVYDILNYLSIGYTEKDAFYNNGVISNTSYIPATPAYLGLVPCVEPKIENGFLYGHDGSREKLLFNDWRDNAQLMLEKMIYDSINPAFKDTFGILGYEQYIPGYEKDTDYTYNEYIELSDELFAKWFANNSEETFTNYSYDELNPFTWNWSSCVDFNGNNLLGHYRGIYNYFYGTYQPDKAPWEMLGFRDKPTWWDEQYGEAPYTSNNLILWQDLADGVIRQGSNAGQYDYLKRPYLLKIIPVDEDGNLLPPNLCGITQQTPMEMEARKTFVYGDGSDAEYDWWQTSEYQYAIMATLYLMKPGFWLEYTWDSLESKSEYVLSEKIHNLYQNGKYEQVIGSAQWISDFLSIRGIDINKLYNLLKNRDIRIGYRAGSYLDYGNLNIKTVNNEILLSNNYQVITYKSSVIRSASMSSMKIAWVDGKYIIYGCDVNEPYFRIFTPNTDINYTYDKSTQLNIFYFREWNDEGEKIPYYTVVDSIQEVYNIIRGYGKYLQSVGFIFQTYDQATQIVVDWDTMAKNFLQWCVSSEREDRDELTLSPWNIININSRYPYSYISFENTFGIVGNICSYTNNIWNVLDINGNAILPNNINVYRQINGVVIETTDMTQISYIHLNVYSQENAIIFDSVQENGYTLYHPLNGETISNLYIESVRTAIWDGALYAPGLILNDEQIIYNYTTRAYNIKDYYNIDSITSVEPLGIIAKSITGYEQDVLLNNIFTNEMSEFNFFNASKMDKGSMNVIKALRRLPDLQSIDVFEIFALLIQEYGSVLNYKELEIEANSEWNTNNPQMFVLNTYKKYRELLNIIGNPSMVSDSVYSTDAKNYISTKNAFNPYGFNWNIKIKVAIDSLPEENKYRTIVGGTLSTTPTLYIDNEDDTITLRIQENNEFKYIKFGNLYIGEVYNIEYGKNNLTYYLRISSDGSTWSEKTYTISKNENINDTKLYIGRDYTENGYWNGGRIILDNYYNSLDSNYIADKNSNVNNIYIDSDEWTSQCEFVEDNRFRKIDDQYSGFYLPYIPLLKLEETQFKIKDESDIVNLLTNSDVKSTDKILVTFPTGKDWELLQVKPTNKIVEILFDNEVDRYGKEAIFKTEKPHGLVIGQTITIDSMMSDKQSWDGVQTVLDVKDEYSFTILASVQSEYTFDESNYPILSEIISRKYTKKEDIDTTYVDNGDLFFVQEDESDNDVVPALYEYNNNELILYRRTEKKINTSLIQQVIFYDKNNPEEYQQYQIFDPYKCIIDLEAKKNITYINSNDPAQYSRDIINDINNKWGEWTNEHVGEVWWDISACKYFDYEISDDDYRSKMWGKMVFGSEIRVYEWVKSPVSPSNYSTSVANKEEVDGYTLSGTPYYIMKEDTRVYPYNTRIEYDEQTKSDKLWYYFWVEYTQYVPNAKNRTLSTSSIVLRINSDMNKTKWFAPISVRQNNDLSYSSTFILANGSNLNDNDNVLQIKYQLVENNYPLHKDWLFFHRALSDSKYREYWEKFKDSISGYDKNWKPVPGVMLNEEEMNGIWYHPMQTMYNDKKLAVKNIIQKINDMIRVINLDSTTINSFNLSNKPVVEVYESYLYQDITEDDQYYVFKIIADPEVSTNQYQVLSENNYKKVNTNNSTNVSSWFWEDALESDYINFTGQTIKHPSKVCQTYEDMLDTLVEVGFNDGDLIYVASDINYNNHWSVYEIISNEPKIYLTQLYQMSDYYEYSDWYQEGIDNFNVIVKTYDYSSDIEADTSYTPKDGDMVKILNGNDNNWSIVQFSDGIWKTVANQNGTIQFTDAILNIDTSDPLSDSSKLFALIVRNILRLCEN